MSRTHLPRPRDGRTEGPIDGKIHPVDASLSLGGWWDEEPQPIPSEYRGTGYTLTPEDEYWRDLRQWEAMTPPLSRRRRDERHEQGSG